MPTVPRYTERQVAIRPESTPYQSARGATADAFGSGQGLRQLAQGLDTVGATATQIGVQDIEREAAEADIQYTSQRRQILYGDGTAQNPGYYSLKGEAAMQAAPEVQQQLQKIREDLSSNLRTENAKRLFGQSSAVRLNSDLQRLGTYVNEQREVANDTISEARIKEAADDAALGYTDPRVLAQSQVILDAEVHKLADRKGWGPEVRQSKLEEARTQMYRQVIVAALKQNDPAAARALYDTYKERMDAPIAAEVFEMIESGTLRAEAQAESDRIMGTGAEAPELLSMARSITDPELRDEVVTRINRRIAEDKAAEEAFKRDAAGEAFQAIFSGSSLDQWSTENPESFELLATDGPLIGSLQRAQDMVAEGRNYARVTNPDVMEQFRRLSTTEKANTDLTRYRADVTPEDYRVLQRAQDSAAATIGDDASARANHEYAIGILRDFVPADISENWRTKAETQEQKDIRNTVTSQMGEFVQGFLDRGTTPTRQEIEAEARRLSQDVTVEDGGFLWFDRDVLAGQVRILSDTDKARVRVDLENVPQNLRESAEETFRAHNVEPTEDLLEQFFGAELAGDAARQRRLLGIDGDTSTVPLP